MKNISITVLKATENKYRHDRYHGAVPHRFIPHLIITESQGAHYCHSIVSLYQLLQASTAAQWERLDCYTVPAWDSFWEHGLTEFKTWICNHIHIFLWDVITHPWPILNSPLKPGHGWIITSHYFMWTSLFVHYKLLQVSTAAQWER